MHGGPGGAGEVAPVARELGRRRGVLEPLQTSTSIADQVLELKEQLENAAELPVVLIGWSWGAWLAWIFAAQHPHLVSKLIMISSGPFEESYLEGVAEMRAERLSPSERVELDGLFSRLGHPSATDRSDELWRLTYLLDKEDAYAPVTDEPAPIEFDSEIFERVWPEAAKLRRSGALLELGSHIRCPIVAIHGRNDPHPPDGVRVPLERVIPDLKFVLLERCGHKPWIERHARQEFYRVLEAELAWLGPRPTATP